MQVVGAESDLGPTWATRTLAGCDRLSGSILT
jgi:hypothetical protein